MDAILNELNALKAKVTAIEGAIPMVLGRQTEEIMKLILGQTKKICELQEKCANLEAIQMNVIASIAISSPPIFATIRENSETGLKQLAEQNLADCDLAKTLRAIAGIQESKKPHLWLLPPRVSPDSNDKSP
jgi:hypothetical protein